MKNIRTAEILPKSHSKGEATPVILLGDWHVEERVDSATVNGKNEYNLEIAAKRAEYCFQNTLRLLEITCRDTTVHNVVIALQGDFISGNIHEELLETALLPPMEAIIFAQDLITSGLEFLLKNTKLKFTIVCTAGGNHARITKERRVATEAGNNLEYYMYHMLQMYFRGNKRTDFVITKGYHSLLNILGWNCRFHHGHYVNYGGGIGGITIPLNKKIAQWNKAEKVDYDFIGHWHQMHDGGNFVINGSLIGWNAYGISIGASYEVPRQSFVLIDKKHGKTVRYPIFLEKP